MREHLEDIQAHRESWVEAFRLVKNEAGNYEFDESESIWSLHADLLDRHNTLVRDWNKFVGAYNSTVKPRPPGRPLEASEAQIADVSVW